MNALAIGIDLVTVARVERMLARHEDRALDRLLTEPEQAYCRSMAFPARHVAARIAAKEAVYKALQGSEDARGIGWMDIEVTRDGDGRPGVRLSGRAQARFTQLGASRVLLSLTHTDDTAAAMAVVVR
jgi:holo-[acyl-carrier protein] synthase